MSTIRSAIFLSVRNKSTRLPGKSLHEVAGQSLTAHLIDRLKLCSAADAVVLTTSTNPDDRVLCDIARDKGVGWFCGSEEDKLDRYLQAATALGLDFFVVVDGDDFLVAETYLDAIIESFKQEPADFISTEDLPFGAAGFGVRTAALAEVVAKKQTDITEVWGAYFTEDPAFTCRFLPVTEAEWRWPELRLTCDYPEDLELVRAALESVPAGEVLRFEQAIAFFRGNPAIAEANQGVKEKYEAHLQKSAPPVTAPPARSQHPWAKALVIGLGSMGKRRIRCLQALGVQEIAGFDPREDRRLEAQKNYGITPVAEVEQGLDLAPNVMIISTPPDLHHCYAVMAAERGIHFFVEAGILDEGADELMALAAQHGSLAAPSCTMRYFPGPKKVKELLASGVVGRPLSFTFHSGQHLEDWHPWENIKDFYVSNPVTGACREIVPFELMWLTDVFGPFMRVTGIRGKYGNLDVAIDDCYHVLLETEDGKTSGSLLVEVLSRPYIRRLRVICSGGSIEWDQNLKIVRWATTAAEEWETWSLDQSSAYHRECVNPEEPYIDEIEAVLTAAKGDTQYPVTFRDEAQILSWLYASETESDRITGRVGHEKLAAENPR